MYKILYHHNAPLPTSMNWYPRDVKKNLTKMLVGRRGWGDAVIFDGLTSYPGVMGMITSSNFMLYLSGQVAVLRVSK